MNLNIVVAGAARSGKTLFCINFAEYLGARSLCYTETGIFGKGRGVISPRDARSSMIHPGSRCNGVMRSFAVNLLRERPRRIVLVDTVSFKEKTPLPRSERRKLLLTLQALQEADAVIYLSNLSCSDPSRQDFAVNAGMRLLDYCRSAAKPFFALGAQYDLVSPASDFSYKSFFPGGKLIPVSSLTRQGFPQLRDQLLRACR